MNPRRASPRNRDPERTTHSPTRVAFICGSFPEDPGLFYELVRLDLQLMVYGTDWAVPGRRSKPSPPRGQMLVRNFRPLIKAHRNQLWFVFPRLAKALSEDQPDIVHVVSEPWGAFALQAAHWCSRHGVGLVIHGCDRIWDHGSFLEQRFRDRLARYTMKRTAAYLAESSASINMAKKRGLAEKVPTAVVHTNPRNPNIFRAAHDTEERRVLREAFGLPADDVVVAYLGALHENKGVFDLLDSMVATRLLDQRVWLAVAGAGPIQLEVVQRLRSMGERTSFFGRLEYPDKVAAFLRATDIVVIPSRTTRDSEEQSPRVAIEAMMSGCAIIASDCGALPEMVGDAGCIYPEGDVPGLGAMLVEVVHNASLRSQIVSRAIERGREHYGVAASANRLFDIWRNLVPPE